jgi:hypothetical protein
VSALFALALTSLPMENALRPVLPLRLAAGVTSLSHSDPGWTLLDPGSDSARSHTATVRFARPFAQVPVVHAGLSGFDIENGDAARVKLRVSGVRADGFELVVETWFETRIWAIDVSWLAIGH